ncbi:MAG: hypothetical protein MPL62_01420 [Alphaproteobacteria bacterium]|nr:hypothetical protein [Alphaproteobacteria bacterium]
MGLSGQGARLAGRGLRPHDVCAVNGARFNLTLIRRWRIKKRGGVGASPGSRQFPLR